MDHRRHVRSLTARFRIAQKRGEPIAIDAFGEIDQIRPFPRHNNSGAAVATRAAKFGEEDGAAFDRWLSGVETLVADDVRRGLRGKERQKEKHQTG
jgi:hypothetical protein